MSGPPWSSRTHHGRVDHDLVEANGTSIREGAVRPCSSRRCRGSMVLWPSMYATKCCSTAERSTSGRSHRATAMPSCGSTKASATKRRGFGSSCSTRSWQVPRSCTSPMSTITTVRHCSHSVGDDIVGVGRYDRIPRSQRRRGGVRRRRRLARKWNRHASARAPRTSGHRGRCHAIPRGHARGELPHAWGLSRLRGYSPSPWHRPRSSTSFSTSGVVPRCSTARSEAMQLDRNGLEVLDRDECLRLLAMATLGRIGFTSGVVSDGATGQLLSRWRAHLGADRTREHGSMPR